MRDVCPVDCVSPWFDVMKCSVAQFRFVYCLLIRVIWFTTHVCNKHTFISSRICMCAIGKRICVLRAGFGFWISYLTWNPPPKKPTNIHKVKPLAFPRRFLQLDTPRQGTLVWHLVSVPWYRPCWKSVPSMIAAILWRFAISRCPATWHGDVGMVFLFLPSSNNIFGR